MDLDRRRFLRLSALTTGGMVLAGAGAGAGLFATSPANAQAQGWQGWPGGRPADAQAFRWGLPELWWYGQAQVFAHRAKIEYRADDATSFWVRGQGRGRGGHGFPLFGVAFTWGRPLPGGHSYRFTARMADPERLPDLITVNDAIVWRREEGYGGADFRVLFEYVPATDGEVARICLVRRAGSGEWAEIYPPHQGQWVDHNLFSQQSTTPVPRPQYETFALPHGTSFTGIDRRLASAYLADEFGAPVAYQRSPLPQLPYPAAEVTFLERGFGLSTLADYAGFVALARPHTLAFQPSNSQPANARTFATWADIAAQGGVKELLVTPVVEQDGQPGVYQFRHLNGAIAGAGTPQQKAAVAAQVAASMAKVANHWLRLVPDGKAYLFHVEMNAAWGNYQGGIGDSNLAALPGYEAIADGGSQAWQLSFDFFQDFRAQVEAALGGNADRVEFISNSDRTGFQATYDYHSGVDVAVRKNIHRQSINIVTANARGAARAYGREYGYDFDTWDRQYSFSHHPSGIRHGLKVMFHAGARYLMDEIRVNPWQAGEPESVSSWGEAWLDFQRYVRSHPRLGAQQVRIAVMRGLGDEWNRMAGRSASWEAVSWLPTAELDRALAQPAPPDKWAKAAKVARSGGTPGWRDLYFSDFNLLNLVFAGFGNPRRTEPDRLATGTPYGPVDFIPWDTPLPVLNQYDVVIYLGRGTDTPASPTRANLSSFVTAGGTLMLAAGQLKRENGEFDFDEPWLGVRFRERGVWDGLPYTRLEPVGPGAEVVSALPNGDPELVRAPAGDGVAYLLSGEWVTYWDEQTPHQALEPLLAATRWLDFRPATSRLEYLVQRKGRSWVFPIFNHGRGWFPSGNGVDRGPWRGVISVDLGSLGLAGTDLACFRAVVSPDGATPVTLQPIHSFLAGGQLRVVLTVAELEELVIGPRDSAGSDYFG